MNSDIRRTRTCENCKTVVPLDKVRLYPKDKERNWLLCNDCCEEQKNRVSTCSNAPPKKEHTVITNKVYVDRKETRIASDRMLKKKYCARCNYSFRIDPEKVNLLHKLKCPYCGKDDQIVDKATGMMKKSLRNL